MSDERRKTNKHSTGTVPKVKYRNNTSYCLNERDGPRSVTNNLATDWHHSDYTNFIRNPRRNTRNNYCTMDATVEEHNLQPTQNGPINFKPNANGTITPNTSSSTSRRNSGQVLKCDNVSKYPDKKQIEDKLYQIREYLRITSSLMTSMKNTDDQYDDQTERDNLMKMISDLTDSETKLVQMLDEFNEPDSNTSENQVVDNCTETVSCEPNTSFVRKNDVDVNVANASRDVELIREHQRELLRLQQKAENKLKDARQIQDKLLMAAYDNDMNSISNNKAKNYSEHDFDAAIKELEERAKRLNEARPSNTNIQDKILAEVDSLHNDIINLRTANDERTQLIDVLDNRDAELRSHQFELQNKLLELQNKKMQVDHLVSQLQDFDDVEEEEDVGGHVRKIVTMKDQLKKLKDMLEIVKTTENIMVNTTGSQEAQAAACEVCTTAENFLQKDLQKSRPHQQNDSNVVLRYDNNTGGAMNDNRHKQVNKNTRDQYGGVKHRTSSVSEKSALQAELEAKKRELEEFMGKHKAGTSNLNHDVGVDNKSEFSCTSNIINDTVGSGWIPLISPQNRPDSSDRFSSDDCQEDINEYSEMNENHNVLPLPSLNFASTNAGKQRTDNNPRIDYAPSLEYDRLHSVTRTPERNVRSGSVATSGYVRERPRSNSEQDSKMQVQKQLHLIKSVCESMLDQQSPTTNNQPSPNVQQLRNNLTPSPLYSEPRRFASPNPHSMNALVHPAGDMPWYGGGNNSNIQNEMANYQGWLATNTLQTQSFMLNTLNQCCQMLWLQQRELATLRSTVSMLQERMDGVPYENGAHLVSPSVQPVSMEQRQPTNQYRPNPSPNQKVNHVSAACSMPNLNHYNTPPSNLDGVYATTHNNIQSGRLLDPCLNNINHLNSAVGGDHTNNTVLHGVNANINQTMPSQMWNGQALNNQVAPGNRANNYWDNFRSYSRQNLLSTKNNEGFQNLPASIDRSNTGSDRTNPFTLMSFSKSNSEQDSASTSQENTPQRRVPLRPQRHVENTNTTTSSATAIPPPDVLNINHNIMKINEQLELTTPGVQQDTDDLNIGFQMLLNAYNDTSSNHSNISEDHIFKECIPEQCRRRNEWNNEVVFEDQVPKTKLFDELRENVYKEVASLISANEARPHFLIQLFRDLQMIGSDSLRLKILQSIQTVITHSLLSTSQTTNRIKLESQLNEHEATPLPSDCFSMQSTVWSKPVKNTTPRSVNIESENSDILVQNPLREIIPFLNDHEGETIQLHLLATLKQMLLESDSFKETVRDTVFQKHFANVLDEVLEQYHGKKLQDVKMHLIQTLSDLFRGEISFIQLIQDTTPDSCNPNLEQCPSGSVHFNAEHLYEMQNKSSSLQTTADNNISHIQNGDLAEADQSRGEDEAEEEGAVGGYLEVPQDGAAKTEVKDNTEDVDLPTIDFPSNAEGLDQVPTRLPTKIKSPRSATPSRDRSNSRQDPSESF